MKNLKIFSFFLLSLFIFKNADSLISKKTIENLIFWNSMLAVADQIDYFLPQNYKFKFWPNLNQEINKPEKISAYFEDNSSYFFYLPIIINKILFSSLEESENFLSILLHGYVKANNLKEFIIQNTNYNENSEVLKNIRKKEGIIIFTEKFLDIFINDILNENIIDKRITKRIFKILLFTGIACMVTFFRKLISYPELKEHLPKITTTTIDNLLENIVTEFIAELLQKYIIDNPEEQRKKLLQNKLQSILESNIPHLSKKNKSPNEKTKKFNFLCSPTS